MAVDRDLAEASQTVLVGPALEAAGEGVGAAAQRRDDFETAAANPVPLRIDHGDLERLRQMRSGVASGGLRHDHEVVRLARPEPHCERARTARFRRDRQGHGITLPTVENEALEARLAIGVGRGMDPAGEPPCGGGDGQANGRSGAVVLGDADDHGGREDGTALDFGGMTEYPDRLSGKGWA
jgi:hypothetical protein